MKRISLAGIIVALLVTMNSWAQLPTAKEVASHMTVGWNLGNTLEAIGGETAWGAAYTTQRLIDSVKATGFNSVRLPVAWYNHCNLATNVIDAAWLTRVKQIVEYCMKDSMYIVMNIHWDNGWLENHVTVADSASVNARQHAFWTQIANTFKDYDEHLLFASANEPNVNDATGMAALLSYHQTFINAVRATGGNNRSRTLVIQGPSTDIDKTNKLMDKFPKDQIDNRLIVEVHYYTPWNFCGLTEDASWGKMFYYWGKGNHSTTDDTRNATWGEESDMDHYLSLMKTKFIDKGIPVIIGEYGAFRRKLSSPSDQALHDKSIAYYYEYFMKSATIKGIKTFCWDTPGWMFNRSTGVVTDHLTVDAIMLGAKEAGITSVAPINSTATIRLYPNPFTSAFALKISDPKKIQHIEIFDMLGKEVETVAHSEISGSMSIGRQLSPGMYIVRVYGENWTKSFKALKQD